MPSTANDAWQLYALCNSRYAKAIVPTFAERPLIRPPRESAEISRARRKRRVGATHTFQDSIAIPDANKTRPKQN